MTYITLFLTENNNNNTFNSAFQSSTVCPSRPKIKSKVTFSPKILIDSFNALMASFDVWSLPNFFNSISLRDCKPSDNLFIPIA